MTSSSITDEARRLPREPTSRWIFGLATVAAAIWLGVFIWQIGVLPPRVPTQFEFSGPPTNWTSKASALITFALPAAVITLTALLSSLVTLRSPRAINAPNRDWWAATPLRLRRFERLLREDLLLFASAALLFLAVAQFGISLAAASPEDGLPPAALVAMLVPAAGLIVAIARLGGAGGRYSKQPDLN